ncbi:hypothetical protein F3Y22_tig00116962pilonHSYRG00455 [Hibiscus syriacus]|uniref:Uncharacterized protein n=1 Tax=Hibiscus syriacus TaxID=106335 RepID=A0A6A2WW11_HIBSY|nr:hypothetical protein F3Y22_tig00116962pilonHSYRG00455 [Hibiscus syriacus]
MVVMKAMGMESDQEVVQMVGRDPRYSALLLPSIEGVSVLCTSLENHILIPVPGFVSYWNVQVWAYIPGNKHWRTLIRREFLNYMKAAVVFEDFPDFFFWTTKSLYAGPGSSEEGKAFSILRDVFLANVPVSCNNFRPKCLYVAVMLRRMMEAILNKDAMDDKVAIHITENSSFRSATAGGPCPTASEDSNSNPPESLRIPLMPPFNQSPLTAPSTFNLKKPTGGGTHMDREGLQQQTP